MDFKGEDKIVLHTNDNDIGYTFSHTVDDGTYGGWLPYGRSISSVSFIFQKYNETDDSWDTISNDDILVDYTLSNNNVLVSLKYPTTNGNGTYRLIISSTLDDGSVKDAYFDQIIADGS